MNSVRKRTVYFILLAVMILGPVNSMLLAETGTDETIKLTLEQAIELALKNNLDIKVDYQTVKGTEGDYLLSKALNDITFSINGEIGSSTRVNTNLFSGGTDEIELIPGVGASTKDTDSWTFSSSLGQTIPTAGRWVITMGISEQETSDIYDSTNPYRYGYLNFNFTQPLLKGFGFSFDIPQKNIVISRNNLQKGLESFKLSVMNRLYDVINSYWTLVSAQKSLEVAQQALDLAKDQLRQNKIKVEVGTTAPIEIVSAESEVAAREAEIISTEATVKAAQDVLMQKLYAPSDPKAWGKSIVAIDEPTYEEVNIDVQEQINLAFENHPDLKSAKLDLENSKLNVKASSWDLLPELNLTASITATGTGGDFLIFNTTNPLDPDFAVIGKNTVEFSDIFDQVFNGQFINWSVGLEFSFPLFNMSARGTHARYKAAEIIAKVNLTKAEQDLIKDVREAVRNLETSYLSIKAREKARILAERQLEAERKKFDVGTSTNFNVLQYVKFLSDARNAEVAARISYNLALYNLQLKTGILLDQNNIKINPLEDE
ncbi:MAG: TolC family protein [Acidobacteria bacterium]|nr:TolC family protein [Acidobacteriota bacterium]